MLRRTFFLTLAGASLAGIGLAAADDHGWFRGDRRRDRRDDDDDHSRHGERRRRRDRDGSCDCDRRDADRRASPTGPTDPAAPVPDNGLFGKTRPKVEVN